MKQHNHKSGTLFHNTGGKVPYQPSFKLGAIETSLDDDPQEDKFERKTIKVVTLMKGIGREAAKRSCDIEQEKYDKDCLPVRVYLYAGNDPVPTYAAFSGAST